VDFGVSRPIANNYSLGIQFEDLVGRKVIRDADNSCPFGQEAAQYPIFDATVQDHDSRLFFSIIVDWLFWAHFLYKVQLVCVLKLEDSISYDLKVEWLYRDFQTSQTYSFYIVSILNDFAI